MTKIYIDENFSHYIAEALHILELPHDEGLEVLSIENAFGKGAKDEDWIPKVGAENGVVITQDHNIHRRKKQRDLYEENGVGVFFFVPSSKTGYSHWQQVELIIRRWQDIKKKCQTPRPFAFLCKQRSFSFERL
jgi:hypothetical protein